MQKKIRYDLDVNEYACTHPDAIHLLHIYTAAMQGDFSGILHNHRSSNPNVLMRHASAAAVNANLAYLRTVCMYADVFEAVFLDPGKANLIAKVQHVCSVGMFEAWLRCCDYDRLSDFYARLWEYANDQQLPLVEFAMNHGHPTLKLLFLKQVKHEHMTWDSFYARVLGCMQFLEHEFTPYAIMLDAMRFVSTLEAAELCCNYYLFPANYNLGNGPKQIANVERDSVINRWNTTRTEDMEQVIQSAELESLIRDFKDLSSLINRNMILACDYARFYDSAELKAYLSATYPHDVRACLMAVPAIHNLVTLHEVSDHLLHILSQIWQYGDISRLAVHLRVCNPKSISYVARYMARIKSYDALTQGNINATDALIVLRNENRSDCDLQLFLDRMRLETNVDLYCLHRFM